MLVLVKWSAANNSEPVGEVVDLLYRTEEIEDVAGLTGLIDLTTNPMVAVLPAGSRKKVCCIHSQEGRAVVTSMTASGPGDTRSRIAIVRPFRCEHCLTPERRARKQHIASTLFPVVE